MLHNVCLPARLQIISQRWPMRGLERFTKHIFIAWLQESCAKYNAKNIRCAKLSQKSAIVAKSRLAGSILRAMHAATRMLQALHAYNYEVYVTLDHFCVATVKLLDKLQEKLQCEWWTFAFIYYRIETLFHVKLHVLTLRQQRLKDLRRQPQRRFLNNKFFFK